MRHLEKRDFLIGLVCGCLLMGSAWLISARWTEHRPTFDELFPPRATRQYDECLVTQRGNVEACDAIMRARDAADRLKRE